MVFTQEFKEKMAAEIRSRVDHARIGDDGTSPSVTQTDVLSQVGGNKLTSTAQTDGIVSVVFSRAQTDPTGVYRELGLFDGDDDMVLRVVHNPINTILNPNVRIRYSVRVFFE